MTVGRTNPTYRDFLDRYEGRFGDYRRALRRDARDDFDRLFERARAYADAAGYANHLDRDRLVLLSMVLGHEAALREREAAIDALDEEVDALAETVDTRGEDVDALTGQVAALADEVETLRAELADARAEPAVGGDDAAEDTADGEGRMRERGG